MYRRNARVLEMRNSTPAYMKGRTYVWTNVRFSQNQNFLDGKMTKLSLPMVLRYARFARARAPLEFAIRSTNETLNKLQIVPFLNCFLNLFQTLFFKFSGTL